MSFVHLHCHSHYSFLRGANAPEELARAAAEMGMNALALTDTNGLYAAIPFYQKAREHGLKPILGVELDIAAPGRAHATRLVLLAKSRAGYSNLCRLITERHLAPIESGQASQADGEKIGGPVSLETLHAHREALIALCSDLELAPWLKEIFGRELYLEVSNFRDASSHRHLGAARELAARTGIPLVATNAVYFLRPENYLAHRVLNAVRTATILSKIRPPEIASPEAYLKSVADMRRLFLDLPGALRATVEIAERSNVQLELGRLIFPHFELPPDESAFSYLWKLAFAGAAERYHPLRRDVMARLEHELAVIERLNLAPYFLIVWDIVREARARQIPVVGRGSAASSIVAYCLGITCLCPVQARLYFERFLNEERGDCPDIDLDVCGLRRDELLDYVYRRYGERHVAMIASFVTMQARLAVREVAKVFGLSNQEVNQFTRRLPRRPVREILEAIRVLPECRELPVDEEPYRTILEIALQVDNFPRHLGIHPCGTVMARAPLTDLVPLELATKGIVVTQYDMNAIEALGLIKMDLLGQRGLTTMSLALKNIEENHGRRVELDAIPPADAATMRMIQQGRTMGVFQIESPAMRQLLKNIRTRSIEDICLALALIRPGAAEYGTKEAFLKRFRGQEPVRYPHPALVPILQETLGLCIYQEQVLQIAQVVGGLNLQEADLLRKPSHKGSAPREREKLRAKFLKTAERLGIPADRLEETWQAVEKFAGFGFCKAHAATYADLAYRIAYLKAHYPAEFLAAMCSAGAGFYHVSAYVEEAKRLGLRVLLPCVNRSRLEYTAEDGALRIGLMQVKGLGVKTVEAILAARAERPSASLEDFLRRVTIEFSEAESLIKCGAMDCFGETRPALLWKLNWLWTRIPARREQTASAEGELFQDRVPPLSQPVVPALEDYSREQRLAYEQEILEVFASGHPLDRVARNGETWSVELERLAAASGRRVTCLGWLITYRHVGTKNYRNMIFLTLEDQRGTFEVVLFPEAYERYGHLIFRSRILRVAGRVEADGQLNGEQVEAIVP